MNTFVRILVGIAIWLALVIAVIEVLAPPREPPSRRKQKHPEN